MGSTTLPATSCAMRESIAQKSGPRASVYSVLRSQAYATDIRFFKSSTKQPYRTGDVYKGNWLKDKKSGYGTMTWAGGSKYEGEWGGNAREGKGTLWIKDKKHNKLRKQYAGDWVKDKREGMGVLYYKDGGRYEGQWKANKRDGNGKMVFADGSIYEGAWVAGARHGIGAMKMPNGDMHEGHYMHDKKEGPGRYLYFSTRKIYEGEWVDDAPRCGEYKDLPVDLVLEHVPDESFTLPSLHMASAKAVLSFAAASIRNQRAIRLGQSERAFSEEEFAILKQGFDAFDEDKCGLVACRAKGGNTQSPLQQVLHSIGLEMGAHEYEALIQNLGAADQNTSVTFPEFIDIIGWMTSYQDQEEERAGGGERGSEREEEQEDQWEGAEHQNV